MAAPHGNNLTLCYQCLSKGESRSVTQFMMKIAKSNLDFGKEKSVAYKGLYFIGRGYNIQVERWCD